MQSVVATRYAHALAEVVLTPDSGVDPKTAVEQVRAFELLINESSELEHVLLSPAVPGAKKRAVIAQLAAQLGLNRKIQNFFFVIIDHRRMDQISGIREALEQTLDERLGFVRADVTSANELTPEQRTSLEAQLGRMTGKRVRTEYAVDPSLIGGVVTRIGSTVYDGSVRGQLESLGHRLATEA